MTLLNPQRHVPPIAVLTQSKLVLIPAVRPVTTVVPKTNMTRPRQAKTIVTKPHSPPRRHINRSPSPKASNFPPQVTAVKAPMNTDGDAAFDEKESEFEGRKPESEVNVSPSSSAQSKKYDDKTKKEAKGKSPAEGIDYEEVFAPVARIEAIRLFLAYASFMRFMVYQMDVKSAFLYGTIEEEVYVCQPPGFEDPDYPDKVYKVVKELYGLHQAPRDCYSNKEYEKDGSRSRKEHEFDAKKPESKVVSLSSSAQSKKQDDKTKKEAKGKSPVESFTGYRNLSTKFKDYSDNSINEVNAADTSQYPDDPDMPELEDITYFDDDDFGAEADFNNLKTSIIVSSIPAIRVHKDHPVTQIIGIKRIKEALWLGTKQDLSHKDTQEEGIDYEEVFAPVARIEAIRLFLTYASFMGFMMYQMDVNSAFLYRTIEEKVYVCQPPGFEDPDHPDKIYVDGIIFGSTNKDLCKSFEKLMKDKFQMSSMRELTFFLGLQVQQKKDGVFISQDKYVAEILRKFGLSDGKSASTPIDTEKPLLKDPDGEDVDVHTYRSMIGSLMYLTSSRPDIMFAVCACVHFQVTLKASHIHAVKRIFRYLKGKPHLRLWYLKDSPFDLVAYSDGDYASASLDRKSTTGGCQFLGCRLISWQCKKQTIVDTSSTKAEYVAAASCSAQVLWIQNQLTDYGSCMIDGKSASTPIDTEKPLLKDPDGEYVDVYTYRSMIGSLMYLTLSRPDIMFAVCACARFQVTLKASHLHAVKRIFRYLKGKPHLGLWYLKDSPFNLVAYLDSDYAGGSLDRKSTTGGCQFLGCRLISWQCKKLTIVATSSTEAEHVAAVSCCTSAMDSESIAGLWNVFANMRKVGKGCSGVETPLFERMIVAHQVDEGASEVNVKDVSTAGVAAEGATSAADDEVPAAVNEPSIPSPTLPTQPQSQDLPSTSQVQLTPPPSPIALPQSPQHQPQPLQDVEISMDLLQNLLDTCTILTRRVENLEHDKIAQAIEITKIETSNDTVMDDVSKQGRIVADIDADKDVTLKDVAAIVKDVQDAEIEESSDDVDIEPAELQEVVDVVTTAKLITEVVTAASASITVAAPQLTTAAAPTLTTAPSTARRRKEVVIRDPEENATPSTIIHTEPKSKDKGKRIMVEEPKPLKKQAQIEQVEAYARELEESKKCSWSSKGQKLEAVRVMWCVDYNIHYNTVDLAGREEISTYKVHSGTNAQ
nr:hypothetical protein [Tanacetum cinerariifolium]